MYVLVSATVWTVEEKRKNDNKKAAARFEENLISSLESSILICGTGLALHFK